MNPDRDKIFRFKQFALSNNLSAMKIGTDGVLLGAWARLSGADSHQHILDIGCGTGVIGMMLAQRYPDAEISCIDINERAVAECGLNIAVSPFADRMATQQVDFLNYRPDKKFDLIVSNPPFFTETIQSPDMSRAVARHEDSLPLSLLLRGASEALAEGGRIALVLPAERDGEVIFEASLAGLYPVRRCAVYTKVGKRSKRTLWELAAGSDNCGCEQSDLYIMDAAGNYSEEYVSLLKDFYLAF